jgi:WD40 repeat protein
MKTSTTPVIVPVDLNSELYIYSIKPFNDSFLVLCSSDKLYSFNGGFTDSKPSWQLDTKHGGTNQIQVKRIENQTVILSAGNDGSIRVWDPRTAGNQEAMKLQLGKFLLEVSLCLKGRLHQHHS